MTYLDSRTTEQRESDRKAEEGAVTTTTFLPTPSGDTPEKEEELQGGIKAENINMLRQWINEKPTSQLVTNEDILHFLYLP